MAIYFQNLLDRAETQRGLLSRSDLSEFGCTTSARRNLLNRGKLVPVGRKVFRVAGVPVDALQSVLAAHLETGGVASHRTAAWLHRMAGFGAGDPPEVTCVRRGADYRLPIAHVHTTTWLPPDDVIEVRGIPTMSVARTLFALASQVHEVSKPQLISAVEDSIRLHKATDAWLWWRLEKLRCRGRTGVTVFEEVLLSRQGGAKTESWLERETLRVLAQAGVPTPECQRRIRHRGAFVARVDFIFPGTRVILEVSGHAAHSTREQRAADARRRNQLVLAGFRVLEFTYEQVVGDPARLVTEVREALSEAIVP